MIPPKPTLILPPEMREAAEASQKRRAERHNRLIKEVFDRITGEIEEHIDVFVFLESLTAGLIRVYVGASEEAQREYLISLMQGVVARLATLSPSPSDGLKAGPSSPIN